jgi:uncharacterized protein (TIGR03067 family)
MKVRILMVVGALLSLAADGPQDKAANADLAMLKGGWRLVSAENDGEKASANAVKLISISIDGNKLTIYHANAKEIPTPIPFTIDSAKKPKAFDQQPAAGQNILGIFELEDDTLRICTAAPGKARPTEFSAKQGTQQWLRVFKRSR